MDKLQQCVVHPANIGMAVDERRSGRRDLAVMSAFSRVRHDERAVTWESTG
jgi:hypothetical protein